MAVKVAWRFRVVCQENPAVSFRIFLKTTQGKTTSQVGNRYHHLSLFGQYLLCTITRKNAHLT